mmetsp:Transcript_1176/g.1187  ORF Transcript_1176/g.1187 Transcript_1176/m.1187 type:complete len:90 (+) Transcript_1176:1449-1718(+)
MSVIMNSFFCFGMVVSTVKPCSVIGREVFWEMKICSFLTVIDNSSGSSPYENSFGLENTIWILSSFELKFVTSQVKFIFSKVVYSDGIT